MTPTLRKAAVAALIVSVGLGVVSDLLFLAAFQFRFDWLADPGLLVGGGPASAGLLRWAALADLCSYYLPTALICLALWAATRSRRPTLALGTMLAGLAYVLAGSLAGASLAMAGPSLLLAYGSPGADQGAISVVFGFLTEVVFRAVWQLVDGIFIAVWMVGIALLLRTDEPRFARLSVVIGALFLVSAAFNALGVDVGRDATLVLVFVVWIVWDAWLAVLIWRGRAPFGDRATLASPIEHPETEE